MHAHAAWSAAVSSELIPIANCLLAVLAAPLARQQQPSRLGVNCVSVCPAPVLLFSVQSALPGSFIACSAAHGPPHAATQTCLAPHHARLPLRTLCLHAVLSLGLAGVKGHRDWRGEPASYHQLAAEKSGGAAAQGEAWY